MGSLDLDVLREKLALLEVSGDSPLTPQSRGSSSEDLEVGINWCCLSFTSTSTSPQLSVENQWVLHSS